MTTVCIEPQTAAQKEQAKILPPGAKAPDFTLHVTPDQCLSLSDLAGKPVVIAFYPADWSPVCGDQMTLYNEGAAHELRKIWRGGPRASPSTARGVTTHSPKHLGSADFCINGNRHNGASDSESLAGAIAAERRC